MVEKGRDTVSEKMTRREIFRGGLAATTVLAMGVPEWATPALAQGEKLVSFTDIPDNFSPGGQNSPVRVYDIRKITAENPFTPRDEFFSIAHYGLPEIEASTFRLQVTGLVDSPREFSLEDIPGAQCTVSPDGADCLRVGLARDTPSEGMTGYKRVGERVCAPSQNPA